MRATVLISMLVGFACSSDDGKEASPIDAQLIDARILRCPDYMGKPDESDSICCGVTEHWPGYGLVGYKCVVTFVNPYTNQQESKQSGLFKRQSDRAEAVLEWLVASPDMTAVRCGIAPCSFVETRPLR